MQWKASKAVERVILNSTEWLNRLVTFTTTGDHARIIYIKEVNMGAHIELDPEVANQLAALAASRGVTVQQLLREFLDQMSTLAPNGPLPTLDEFETDMREFADGTENLQSFYTGDYSREDIHFDHD